MVLPLSNIPRPVKLVMGLELLDTNQNNNAATDNGIGAGERQIPIQITEGNFQTEQSNYSKQGN